MKIGILGAGQLGRMLALSGYPLGHRFVFLDPSAEACAGSLGKLLVADYEDEVALDAFCDEIDAATLEFENVPVAAVERVARRRPFHPGARALATAQDRLHEKQLFSSLGIALPGFAAVDSIAEIRAALDRLGYPAMLKTRRFGYDGKGQTVIRRAADVAAEWPNFEGKALILEEFIAFDAEVSCIGVRAADGAVAFYPLVQNYHRDGVLRLSRPLRDCGLQADAYASAQRVMQTLDYVGVMAFEFFVAGGGLLANEIAPRVHNSGHWTIEGASCSQFENHLRAVTDSPLGATALVGTCMMYNFVGCEPPQAALSIPGVHLHRYDKAAKAGRKLAHVTVTAADADELADRCARLEALAEWPEDLLAANFPPPPG